MSHYWLILEQREGRIPDRQLRKILLGELWAQGGSWSRKGPAARGSGEVCMGYQLPFIPSLAAGGFWSLLLGKQTPLLSGALVAFDQMLRLCQVSLNSVLVASKLTCANPRYREKSVGLEVQRSEFCPQSAE